VRIRLLVQRFGRFDAAQLLAKEVEFCKKSLVRGSGDRDRAALHVGDEVGLAEPPLPTYLQSLQLALTENAGQRWPARAEKLYGFVQRQELFVVSDWGQGRRIVSLFLVHIASSDVSLTIRNQYNTF